MDKAWKNNDSRELFGAILKLKTTEECEAFFRDLCTIRELSEMTQRFKIARMLTSPIPKSYLDIASEVGTSTTTVTRVAHWLNSGEGGYKKALGLTQ